MSAATPSNSRIRQIAILVSSVDAATARQLLLHLPTETAKRVRSLAAELGPITPEEKRKILSEFQKSATGRSGLENRPANAAPTRADAKLTETDFAASPGQNETANDRKGDAGDSKAAAWTRLSTDALVRFVRGERPAVIAVVISQLAPEVGVQVLQHLSQAINHDVLTRLSRLQEVDAEAMQAIDSYLSERLVEYQHTLESEGENKRRIQALLSAAPTALREQWERVFDSSAAAGHASAPPPTQHAHVEQARAEQARATIAERSATMTTHQFADASPLAQPTSGGPVIANQNAGQRVGQAAQHRQQDHDLSTLAYEQMTDAEDEAMDSAAEILPFPGAPHSSNSADFDHSLAQLEFEQILELPANQLAHLLSASQAETVLLALAGATPQFMHRFYGLLNASDAHVLRERLQTLGKIQLRDIDEAQRRIVELSLKLGESRQSPSNRQAAARQVA